MAKWSRKGSLYFTAFIIHTGFNIIVPFYPGIASSKGLSVSTIGIVMSLEPIMGVLASLIVLRYLETFGRRNSIVASLVFQAASNILLCPIAHVEKELLLTLSILSRLLSGISISLGMIPSYSILTSEYPEEVQEVVGYLESAMGLGLIIGPILGSLLYIDHDVLYSFLIVSLLIGLFAPLEYWILGEDKKYSKRALHFSSRRVLTNKKILLDFVIVFLVMFQLECISTLIEIHLLDLGFSEEFSGYYFSLLTISFFVFSIVVTFLPRGCDKRLVMVLGLMLFVISLLMMGPQIWNSRWAVIASLPISGAANAIAGVPTIPHMIEVAKKELKEENDDRLNDCLSAWVGIFDHLGEILGPIFAGIMGEFLEFKDISNALAVMFGVYLIIYSLFSGGLIKLCKSRKYIIHRSNSYIRIQD